MRFQLFAAAAAALVTVSGAASAATVNFGQQGTFTTPEFVFAGGSVTGSADLNLLADDTLLNGLGVVGGTDDAAIDNQEFIDLMFDIPAMDVSIFVSSCSGDGAPCGSRTVELFGDGGASLGSFMQVSVGNYDLSALVAGALISSIRIQSASNASFVLYELTFELAPEVPLPAALPLFIAGIAGLGAAARRKKSAATR